jgi:hypothetical protein
VLNERPAGRLGEIDHDVAGDPEFTGVIVVIAELTTKL